MDKIAKLFRKINEKDRSFIEECLGKILKKNFSGLHLKKLKDYRHIFRVRAGNYRIIYYDDSGKIILKAIKKRDESTYSHF